MNFATPPSPTQQEARVHIIGAGLAGLAAAVHCRRRGLAVTVYEAANHAGGRCRSFHDTVLDRVIDNGNHLVLGGNEAIFEYLGLVGAGDVFAAMDGAEFPFFDVRTGERWQIRPNAGPLPWWVLAKSRRVPGSSAFDYLRARRMAKAPASATVADCVTDAAPMFERFWQPLSRAVLNTDARDGAASLLWRMIAETLLKGAAPSRPHLARDGLSKALVEPTLAWLQGRGADIRFGRRVREIRRDGDRVTALGFGQDSVAVNAGDAVIAALPPTEVSGLLPEITVPDEFRAIVNVHFRCDDRPRLPGPGWMVGLTGGTAQWVFQRGDILSVTVSDAGALADADADAIATATWTEVARAVGRPDAAVPPFRVVKEHRATIAQTPAQVARRPDSATAWQNLFLAGDWTDTGLPATIESAVHSGRKAAEFVEIRIAEVRV